jgi:negative regulator of sigma E activity
VTTREEERGPTPDTEERWHLLDEIDFFTRSLQDLDAELAAGDLSSADHDLLHRRDEAKLEELRRRLEESIEPEPVLAAPVEEPASKPVKVRSRRAKWAAAIGAAAVAAGVVLLVIQIASPRLPGQSDSGTVQENATQAIEQSLSQANTLVGENQPIEALHVLQGVLATDPHQPTALAEAGEIEWQLGYSEHQATLMRDGRKSVNESLQADPNLALGHLFLGIILLEQDHQPAEAVGAFAKFLNESPPTPLLEQAAPTINQAYGEAGRAVPAAVQAALAAG